VTTDVQVATCNCGGPTNQTNKSLYRWIESSLSIVVLFLSCGAYILLLYIMKETKKAQQTELLYTAS